MTIESATGRREPSGGRTGRPGTDGTGTRVAQPGKARRNHSLQAQHRGCATDEGIARRGDWVECGPWCALRGCRGRDGQSPERCAGSAAVRAGRGAGQCGKCASLDWRTQHGELIARGVKAFGFNTTLAPVVDLALPESAEVMGTRVPGTSAAEVVALRAGISGRAGCTRRGGMRKAFSGPRRRGERYAFL